MREIKIPFVATVRLASDCPYTDDMALAQPIKEAFEEFLRNGLFDVDFSPQPKLPFEATNNGHIERYQIASSKPPVSIAELHGFRGRIDGQYPVEIQLCAEQETPE